MKSQLLRMLQDWRAQKHPCAMVTHLAISKSIKLQARNGGKGAAGNQLHRLALHIEAFFRQEFSPIIHRADRPGKVVAQACAQKLRH